MCKPANVWFVSRQCYWGVDDEDRNAVEIARGGSDYANADMLVPRWRSLGEGDEFTDPREALAAAKRVRDAWLAASPDCQSHIEVGYTGGMTMPFTDHPDDTELEAWAESLFLSLPRCDRCGRVIERESYRLYDGTEELFCSEYCAEEAWIEALDTACAEV